MYLKKNFNICLHFLIPNLTGVVQADKSFLASDKDPVIGHRQYDGSWWLGDTRSHGISSYDIDQVCPEQFGLSNILVDINPLRDNFFRGNIKHISIFYVIPPHWYDAGGWNTSSNKTMTCLFYIVKIMAAAVLATQGARTSAVMILI